MSEKDIAALEAALEKFAEKMDAKFELVFRKMDRLAETRAACERNHGERLTRLEQTVRVLWPFVVAAAVGTVGYLAQHWAGGMP